MKHCRTRSFAIRFAVGNAAIFRLLCQFIRKRKRSSLRRARRRREFGNFLKAVFSLVIFCNEFSRCDSPVLFAIGMRTASPRKGRRKVRFAKEHPYRKCGDYSTISMDLITMGVWGLSALSRGIFKNSSTVSMPSITFPKAAY